MSETDIERLRELEQEATEAPWRATWGTIDRGRSKGQRILRCIVVPHHDQKFGCRAFVASPAWNEFDGGIWDAWIQCRPEDAELLIELRNTAPALLDELERLRAENRELRAALEEDRDD